MSEVHFQRSVSCGALDLWRAAKADQSPPRHRCPALASFPPTGPALRMRDADMRQQSRNPGLPSRLAPGVIQNAALDGADMKNPSGAVGSGGGPITDVTVRSERTASMSRASIGEWPAAIQRSRVDRITVLHCQARSPADTCPRKGASYTRRRSWGQPAGAIHFCVQLASLNQRTCKRDCSARG
jgi:hypothetical protein